MKIKGIVWLGTRTDRFEQMTDFCRDLLGLSQSTLEPGFAVFEMPNGDLFEVFDTQKSTNAFMTHPVAGFLVDDIAAARAEMEARGIEFIGPIEGDTADYKWTHFRAPDGFVYELTYSTAHPSSAA
ncbi:MAG TPA: VOC family protein [Anaerolineales bacterium]|nr:VOC family protein [Anaerolineales bacterium]